MNVMPNPAVVSRLVGGETVLVDLDHELYFSLNGTGSLVWEGLAEGCSLDEIVDRTVNRYEIDQESAKRDVELLIRQLVEAGLAESN